MRKGTGRADGDDLLADLDVPEEAWVATDPFENVGGFDDGEFVDGARADDLGCRRGVALSLAVSDVAAPMTWLFGKTLASVLRTTLELWACRVKLIDRIDTPRREHFDRHRLDAASSHRPRFGDDGRGA